MKNNFSLGKIHVDLKLPGYWITAMVKNGLPVVFLVTSFPLLCVCVRAEFSGPGK
jgi:hypothetical protein